MDRVYENEFDSRHIKEFNNQTKFILWGASTKGKIISNMLQKMGVNIINFCDSDSAKIGKSINGIKILSTENLFSIDSDTYIIITSSFEDEIYRELEQMGLNDKVRNIDEVKFTYKIINRKNKAKNYLSGIERLYNILEDQKSINVLKNIIYYRVTGDLELLYRVGEMDEYFPDIIKIGDNEVFVDAGAYNGDTVIKFMKRTENKYKKVYAFEPDSKMFRDLEWNMSHNDIVKGECYGKVQIFNLGLYSSSKKINFTGTGKMDSKIDEYEGKDIIEVVKLDDILLDEKVTFIKMDIEGAEIEAIKGAKNIIMKNKPKLAICVYHKKSDLWEIPLLIKEICPDYKIYLRHHGMFEPYEMCDTVCYAVPKNK